MDRVLIAAWCIAASLPTEAWAKDIPLTVSWIGAAPKAAFISVPGGLEPLKAAGPMFDGTISIPPGPPERRTVTLRYGNYNHSFDIQVIPLLTSISFAVDHQAQRSCTKARVKEANFTSDNLLDAIKRSVNAGELYAIPEPNACDKNLRFAAVRAAILQNAAMRSLSNGLFLINGQIKKAYEAAAKARGSNVSVELASYDATDRQFEVTQLNALKAESQEQGDYDYALEINEYMADRIGSSPSVAAIYQSRGVTADRLKTDAVFITTTKASAVGTPIPPGRIGERGFK